MHSADLLDIGYIKCIGVSELIMNYKKLSGSLNIMRRPKWNELLII